MLPNYIYYTAFSTACKPFSILDSARLPVELCRLSRSRIAAILCFLLLGIV